MKMYPWLHSHFKHLVDNYLIGREHCALLIQSLPGLGADDLIYSIICFLVCQYPKENKNCGICRGCQLMKAQTHPDFYLIEQKTDKTTFGVDIVHKINKKIYEHAYMGGVKVIWLKNVTQITNAAANALLKIIEEPPPNTWFFLSCCESKNLLITLRSRCYLYHLKSPNENLAINWLKHKIVVTPKEAYLSSLRQCGGAPIAALEQLQPKIWLQRDKLYTKLSEVLQSGSWFDLLDFLNQEKVLQKLCWLISLMLDAMKLQVGSKLFTNPDVLPLINKLAEQLPGVIINAIINEICKAYKQILTISWSNLELPLTNLLLRIEHFLKTRVELPNASFMQEL